MISCFGNRFKPLGPCFFFSRDQFGEVDVIATKQTYFFKTRDNYFPRRFGPQMCAVSFALFDPAMKKKLGSWVLSFLYVYSDHSILECYNLFSGVELSMRSFFVISMAKHNNKNISLLM